VQEAGSARASGVMTAMLGGLLTFTPQATIAAIAIVSVFNVGYFSRIGLHFIGLMDITNLVYAIALVFSSLILLVQIVVPIAEIDWFLTFAKSPDAFLKMRRWTLLYILPIMTIALAATTIPNHYRPTVVGTSRFVCLVFTLSSAWMMFSTYVTFYQNRLRPHHLIVPLTFLLSAVFFAGRETAAVNAFLTTDLYRVITKDKEILSARILRTSSSGILLSLDGSIIYLPKEEIKQVLSQQTLTYVEPSPFSF
jgi:hypothetical protein